MIDEAEIRALLEQCFNDPEDRVAVGCLYREFSRYLFVILVGLAPQHHDLAQDALHDAFRKYMAIFTAGRRDGVDYLRYFVTIAKNCMRDILARERRLQTLGEAQLEGLRSQKHAQNPVGEDLILVGQLLARLDHRCRVALERWYFAGASSEELAKVLAVAPGSVYVVLRRCREKMANLAAER